MNKEKIENMKEYFIECITKDTIYGEDLTLYYMQIAKEYINYLKQKETILDKVTDYTKMYIDDKQNEYEAISESYVCQTDEDEYIKEKKLAIIKGQKQVLKNVLNIIEGEKNGTI